MHAIFRAGTRLINSCNIKALATYQFDPHIVSLDQPVGPCKVSTDYVASSYLTTRISPCLMIERDKYFISSRSLYAPQALHHSFFQTFFNLVILRGDYHVVTQSPGRAGPFIHLRYFSSTFPSRWSSPAAGCRPSSSAIWELRKLWSVWPVRFISNHYSPNSISLPNAFTH